MPLGTLTEQLRRQLRRLKPIAAGLHWLRRDAARQAVVPWVTLVRWGLPTRLQRGPPRGCFSAYELLVSKPAALEGRVILTDQGAAAVPTPSLMERAGLGQHREQPWPVFWSRHPRARLVGPGLAHVDESKQLCVEAVYGRARLRDDPAYRAVSLAAPLKLAGTWTSVVSRWVPVDRPSSYAHWLLDALPRLAVLADLPPETAIIVPPHRLPYQEESLRLLGVAHLCRWTAETHLVVEDYRFSSPPSMIVCYSPYAVNFLRSRLLGHADSRQATPRRFYLHRSRRRRGAANEDEVLEFFARRGWEIVDTAALSLPRQIALFAGAEAICGVHGAGFTNVAWCRPGCQVIELCGQGYLNGCFEWLSQCVSARHRFLVFPTDEALNITVDLTQVSELLAAEGLD